MKNRNSLDAGIIDINLSHYGNSQQQVFQKQNDENLSPREKLELIIHVPVILPILYGVSDRSSRDD